MLHQNNNTFMGKFLEILAADSKSNIRDTLNNTLKLDIKMLLNESNFEDYVTIVETTYQSLSEEFTKSL